VTVRNAEKGRILEKRTQLEVKLDKTPDKKVSVKTIIRLLSSSKYQTRVKSTTASGMTQAWMQTERILEWTLGSTMSVSQLGSAVRPFTK
jgi:hypothetical protein